MKKLAIAFAGLAALGFSGAAFAEDGTTGWTTSTGPAAMSDTEMDKVTAGAQPDVVGTGTLTAADRHTLNGATPNGPNSPPEGKGVGTGTLPGPANPTH